MINAYCTKHPLHPHGRSLRMRETGFWKVKLNDRRKLHLICDLCLTDSGICIRHPCIYHFELHVSLQLSIEVSFSVSLLKRERAKCKIHLAEKKWLGNKYWAINTCQVIIRKPDFLLLHKCDFKVMGWTLHCELHNVLQCGILYSLVLKRKKKCKASWDGLPIKSRRLAEVFQQLNFKYRWCQIECFHSSRRCLNNF